jgi:hypothetical protein
LPTSWRVSAACFVLVLGLTACSSPASHLGPQGNHPPASAGPAATLADLSAVRELGGLFNAHKDETQLILLLSPG